MSKRIWHTVGGTVMGFLIYAIIGVIAHVAIVSVASFFHHIPNPRYNPNPDPSGGLITHSARLLGALFAPVVAVAAASTIVDMVFKRWYSVPLIILVMLSATPLFYYAFVDGWRWPDTAIQLVNGIAIVVSALELRRAGERLDGRSYR